MAVLVTIRGRLRDEPTAIQAIHDAVTAATKAMAVQAGDISHRVYLNPQDGKDFLGIVEWESAQAVQAFAAIRRLASAPREAAVYLRERVKPVPATDERHVKKLIADLDSDDFETRDRATKDLEALGEAIVGPCEAALAGTPPVEPRRRLAALRDKFADAWRKPSRERLRVIRALEALEMCGSGEARDVLAALAKGAPGAYITEQAKAALKRVPPGP